MSIRSNDYYYRSEHSPDNHNSGIAGIPLSENGHIQREFDITLREINDPIPTIIPNDTAINRYSPDKHDYDDLPPTPSPPPLNFTPPQRTSPAPFPPPPPPPPPPPQIPSITGRQNEIYHSPVTMVSITIFKYLKE